MVHLRARYYAPGVGRFVSRDVWAGDYRRPLSLNGWNYVEGNPVNLTDPTGHSPWPPENVAALYVLRQTIFESAQRHNNFAKSGFTNEAFAALMATHLNRESRFGALTKRSIFWDPLGDFLAETFGYDASTGIANTRPGVALEILRGEIPGVPIGFNYEICGSRYQEFLLNPEIYVVFPFKPGVEEARQVVDEEYIGKSWTWTSDEQSEGLQRRFVYDELQDDVLSIEYLAANVERGVDRARYFGVRPSVFNLGNWLWRGVQRREEFEIAWNRGEDLTRHGTALIGDMPKAFQVLGLPMTYYNAYNPDEADFVDRSFFLNP